MKFPSWSSTLDKVTQSRQVQANATSNTSKPIVWTPFARALGTWVGLPLAGAAGALLAAIPFITDSRDGGASFGNVWAGSDNDPVANRPAIWSSLFGGGDAHDRAAQNRRPSTWLRVNPDCTVEAEVLVSPGQADIPQSASIVDSDGNELPVASGDTQNRSVSDTPAGPAGTVHSKQYRVGPAGTSTLYVRTSGDAATSIQSDPLRVAFGTPDTGGTRAFTFTDAGNGGNCKPSGADFER